MSEIVIGNRVGGKGRKREEEEEKKMKFNGYGTTVMAKSLDRSKSARSTREERLDNVDSRKGAIKADRSRFKRSEEDIGYS